MFQPLFVCGRNIVLSYQFISWVIRSNGLFPRCQNVNEWESPGNFYTLNDRKYCNPVIWLSPNQFDAVVTSFAAYFLRRGDQILFFQRQVALPVY